MQTSCLGLTAGQGVTRAMIAAKCKEHNHADLTAEWLKRGIIKIA